MKRVLAIGECMAELAPAGQPRDFTLGFAGDTFNTAWYLAQIAPDLDISYFTAIGDDSISQDMQSFFDASGINSTPVQVIPDKTVGLYLIHLNNGERSFSYWRDSSAARQLAVDGAALQTAMAEADFIYYSGITLAILDQPSRENLFQALRQARRHGKEVAFDTNLRPRLWTDTQQMTSTIMEAAACCDLVLPSYDDEAVWFGDRNVQDTIERYAGIGVRQIVVKNSDQSVVFQTPTQRGTVTVDPVTDVIDTTAAGDSFNAGVFAEILMGRDISIGIERGCQLARQVVQHKGALVCLPPQGEGASQ
ncbi:2-dehydro-3-deoxygluconokinase [Ascidiaceihabitans donghaensis]|uniref:2-dehydro-3-deoxygluconokinase n=1 Tax=Ascidiaceihabitans donghaensis TaxID=1510460 RepID=A0A2R8BDA1_9RHOB|nr:sugar kinase [Ascidiaceihabitans donghaensis]SPH21054.1 2-dehydro-3-deoxygluconokinase [Ascidiaceihabitans donghaensis]